MQRFLFALVLLSGCAESAPQATESSAPQADRVSLVAQASPAAPAEVPVTPKADPAFWPQWRGPKYDGIAYEPWSADWPKDGLPQVWKAQIGIGFSSMSLAEGRLFAMGWSDDQETVYCLDPLTGKERWKYSYPGRRIDNLHEGGPGATPTIEGDVVYTLGREGQLFCLRVEDGSVVWRKSLTKEAGVDVPEWGFTSSPLIEQDMVIVDAGRVMAFHKRTGDRIWQTEPFDAGYGTAAAFSHDGQRLVAVLNNECLLVLNAKDGKEVARHPFETQYKTTSTTPVVSDDLFFISSGYGRGCVLLRLKGGQLEEVYDNKNLANHFNNSVLFEGHLYGIDGNTHAARLGKLVCLDFAKGEEKWSQRGFGIGSLVVGDNKCLVLTDDGVLVACAASPDGYRELARARILEGKCWTVPVLAGGHVYARNADGDLVCVKLPEKE